MMQRALIVVLTSCLLLACQPVRAPQPGPAALPELGKPADATRWVIDGNASLLTVRVYRGGRMASIGHNHIVSSRDLRGELWLTDERAGSVFEIRLPVSTMRVDEPDLRAAAGEEFSGELDAGAIEGTRTNMLSAPQLDADNWPMIVVRGNASGEDLVEAWLAVKTQVRPLQVPVKLSRDGDRLTVSGSFAVTQTELGLEPFSVMLGALRVEDRLDIDFRIEAALVALPLLRQAD